MLQVIKLYSQDEDSGGDSIKNILALVLLLYKIKQIVAQTLLFFVCYSSRK